MKEELALSMVLVMLLLLTNSFLHLVQIEPISNNISQILDNNQPSSTNFHHKVNEKKNIGDQNCVAENPKEEGIQEGMGENQTQNENENYNQTFEKTLQNDASQNANYKSPPDGHVYLTGDQPYPYSPTQTPKGWGTLPVQPPKTED